MLDCRTGVLVGKRKRLYKELKYQAHGSELRLHQWVDLADYVPKLSKLTFFRAIGTTWHCLNHSISMLVVPGLIGDQFINGEAI